MLLAPIAALRLVARIGREPRPASDLERTPRGVLNGGLEQILRAEAAWIGSGRDIPTGVSLLAVLRRAER